jgi:hypothetical protein
MQFLYLSSISVIISFVPFIFTVSKPIPFMTVSEDYFLLYFKMLPSSASFVNIIITLDIFIWV